MLPYLPRVYASTLTAYYCESCIQFDCWFLKQIASYGSIQVQFSLLDQKKTNDYCLFPGTDSVKSDGVLVAWRVSSAAAQEERSPTSELDIDLFFKHIVMFLF